VSCRLFLVFADGRVASATVPRQARDVLAVHQAAGRVLVELEEFFDVGLLLGLHLLEMVRRRFSISASTSAASSATSLDDVGRRSASRDSRMAAWVLVSSTQTGCRRHLVSRDSKTASGPRGSVPRRCRRGRRDGWPRAPSCRSSGAGALGVGSMMLPELPADRVGAIPAISGGPRGGTTPWHSRRKMLPRQRPLEHAQFVVRVTRSARR